MVLQPNLNVILHFGKVVGIVERNWREYVATIPKEEANSQQKRSGKRILVYPYDYRIPKIRVLTSQAQKLVHERIVVRIDNWPVRWHWNSIRIHPRLMTKLFPHR